MINHYVALLKNKSAFELKYGPFGVVNQIVITDNSTVTCIGRGNDHFEGLLAYIDESIGRPTLKFAWVETVRDQNGNFLHYRTDHGQFIDATNEVTISLKQQIDEGTLEIRETANEPHLVALEANIFLPRAYTVTDTDMRQLNRYDFGVKEIGLPFRAQVSLLQSIEPEFFASQEFLSQHLKNVTGNVVRIQISSKDAESIYKWAIPHLEASEATALQSSIEVNLALHKRSKSRGPTSSW